MKKTHKKGIKAREIWHLYPFNVRRIGSDGKTYFKNPSFFLTYLDDNFPDNEFGAMQHPPQDEINLVIDATNPEGGTLDEAKVIPFLKQRCNVQDVEPMTWESIVASISQHEKNKHWMKISVVTSCFNVSTQTLKRAIKDKKIKSYRPKGGMDNAEYMVDAVEIARHWTRKESSK